MLDVATDAKLFREARLAVLFSLGWRVLWLPLRILFPLHSLLRHPRILFFACAAYAAIIVWKLASASRLFRKADALTVWFGLLLAYAVVFVAFLLWLVYVQPPQPTDLMIVPTLYIMAVTFIFLGGVFVISPETASPLDEVAGGKNWLVRAEGGHPPRTPRWGWGLFLP